MAAALNPNDIGYADWGAVAAALRDGSLSAEGAAKIASAAAILLGTDAVTLREKLAAAPPVLETLRTIIADKFSVTSACDGFEGDAEYRKGFAVTLLGAESIDALKIYERDGALHFLLAVFAHALEKGDLTRYVGSGEAINGFLQQYREDLHPLYAGGRVDPKAVQGFVGIMDGLDAVKPAEERKAYGKGWAKQFQEDGFDTYLCDGIWCMPSGTREAPTCRYLQEHAGDGTIAPLPELAGIWAMASGAATDDQCGGSSCESCLELTIEQSRTAIQATMRNHGIVTHRGRGDIGVTKWKIVLDAVDSGLFCKQGPFSCTCTRIEILGSTATGAMIDFSVNKFTAATCAQAAVGEGSYCSYHCPVGAQQ
ncbi:MAG: hypothetical protein HYV03_06435 [Deltaproteobacteria bacterium]|nr:hypothetical protein [Deltaproteobacteria bacterium]